MGRFIDGGATDVRRNVFLAVENGIITALDSESELPIKNGTVIDEFSHSTSAGGL